MKPEDRDFLKSIGINPDMLPEDIEDKLGDYFIANGFDKDYNLTAIGRKCEDILSRIDEFEVKE